MMDYHGRKYFWDPLYLIFNEVLTTKWEHCLALKQQVWEQDNASLSLTIPITCASLIQSSTQTYIKILYLPTALLLSLVLPAFPSKSCSSPFLLFSRAAQWPPVHTKDLQQGCVGFESQVSYVPWSSQVLSCEACIISHCLHGSH